MNCMYESYVGKVIKNLMQSSGWNKLISYHNDSRNVSVWDELSWKPPGVTRLLLPSDLVQNSPDFLTQVSQLSIHGMDECL